MDKQTTNEQTDGKKKCMLSAVINIASFTDNCFVCLTIKFNVNADADCFVSPLDDYLNVQNNHQ